ncbi:MAG: ABC transporter substrate-binding protein [Alphaproteobacteria bacterium]|nr:ABC transporter substrate-binding protein [Alphaproteobacteria bacterium]
MKFTKLTLGVAISAMLTTGLAASKAAAEDKLFIPVFSYRTGAFAGSGIPQANGFTDYLNLVNERDGGINGVKIQFEECETGYKAQKGVECYEATKGRGALVYNPYSTGITLQLIPKAPIDKIPVLSMGYGLSASAVGEKFPWTFNVPATYWSQASAVVKYIDSELKGGIKGKKVGFIFLDSGYGREPIPLFEKLADQMGFKLFTVSVGVKEMQSQASHWLQVRKEQPDYMVMWGWGAMNPTALKEAAKIRYPMDKFIGVWWSGSEGDVEPAGKDAIGFKAMSFHGAGTDYKVIQEIKKHVIDKGKSVGNGGNWGEVLYNRAVFNAMLVVEAIRNAQNISGKKIVIGEDVRKGLETLNLTEARLAELGFANFSQPIKVTCKDHAGAHPMFVQQWDGKNWNKVSDWITPMRDVVRPLLEEAAEKYVAEKKDWLTQKCDG